MSENAGHTDDDESLVYSVRPEPPRFEKLIPRPEFGGQQTMLSPPGPIRRWLGAHRARLLFRAGLVVALGFVVAVIVL